MPIMLSSEFFSVNTPGTLLPLCTDSTEHNTVLFLKTKKDFVSPHSPPLSTTISLMLYHISSWCSVLFLC